MIKTSDYSQFKEITSNREVDEKHVKNLMESIKERNMLHLNPIIINKQFQIVDGQHRLEAAERLSVPIYYIMDDDVSKNDIHKLNSNKKNWKSIDFINYHTVEGVPEFVELSKFIFKYPDIKITAALSIFSIDGSRKTSEIRAGHINIGNKEQAYIIAEIVQKFFNKGYDFVFDSRFAIALRKSLDAGLDQEIFFNKIDLQPRKFLKCSEIKEYVLMITELYNYRSSKNILKLS